MTKTIKIALGVLGGFIVLLVLVAVLVPKEKDAATAPAEAAAPVAAPVAAPKPASSNIYLVASQSFCAATGIDDDYTGDGHVTFYLTFKNTGGVDGTVSAIPVRHYDDGELNESLMDEVEVDVAAGQTEKVHTTAMVYSAHSHGIDSCGIVADGRGEVPIAAS